MWTSCVRRKLRQNGLRKPLVRPGARRYTSRCRRTTTDRPEATPATRKGWATGTCAGARRTAAMLRKRDRASNRQADAAERTRPRDLIHRGASLHSVSGRGSAGAATRPLPLLARRQGRYAGHSAGGAGTRGSEDATSPNRSSYVDQWV